MAFIYFNPNPSGKRVGDCVIRGISFLTEQDWEKTYIKIVMQGFAMFDMPSSNAVWAEYLRKCGYKKFVIPDTCPECYTVKNFCEDNPSGKYLLATGSRLGFRGRSTNLFLEEIKNGRLE